MSKPGRVPGLIFNVEHALFLKFQFNPTTLMVNKRNNYPTIPIPGWSEPVIVWAGGDAKTINFELFFESTSGSGGLVKLIGVRDVEAVLESFLYPGNKIKSPSLKALKSNIKQPVEEFIPPPLATFVFGPNWWQGYLSVDNRKLEAFDRALTPRQLTCNCTLTVASSGTFFAKDDEVRRALATVVYPLNHAVDVIGSVTGAVSGVVSGLSNTVRSIF